MKLSGLVILVIAIVLASGAAFLVDQWLSGQQAEVGRFEDIRAEKQRLEERLEEIEAELRAAREAAEREPTSPIEIETETVLAAATDLAVGDKITRQDVRLINVLPDARPRGAFTSPGQVVGDLVLQPISEGEIIMPARLTKEGRLPLAARLTAGMRAITLDIGTTAGQTNLVAPGSRVDVIVGDLNDYGHFSVNRILQDIRVLALDQREESPGVTITDARSVTLEVTPSQARLLSRVAAERKEMRLTLRNQADSAIVDDGFYSLNLIRGTDACNTLAGQDCRVQ